MSFPQTTAGFSCRRLGLVYDSREGDVEALAGLDLEVRPAEFVCIVGPSGCGKSSLLKVVAGLLSPSSGEVCFPSNGSGRTPRNALVFQEHGLFPWMSVLQNVAFGLEMQGVPKKERERSALSFIERVGLAAFAHHYPHQLSIGMSQRVAIARAFVSDAELLLMDEPFGSLDSQTRRVLQDELLSLWRSDRKTVVYVTHDIEEAILLGDRIVVMTGRPGRILREFPVAFSRPRSLDDAAKPVALRMKREIWELLREEVRSNLGVGGERDG